MRLLEPRKSIQLWTTLLLSFDFPPCRKCKKADDNLRRIPPRFDLEEMALSKRVGEVYEIQQTQRSVSLYDSYENL